MTAVPGALVGAALLAAGYVAGRRSRPAAPLEEMLEVPPAELESPDELPHAWLEWDPDPRVWRSLVLLRCAEQSGNAVWEASVRKGLAGLGYRA